MIIYYLDYLWVSHGVVVSGWESQSSSLPIDFEFGGKHCCNLSDYNDATFPLDGQGLYRNFGLYLSINFNHAFPRSCSHPNDSAIN